MAENSKIEWTTHTFNAWIGCTKVSPGCANCYAETSMDKHYHKAKWGPRGLRVIKAESGWREPIKWNRLAMEAGEVHRVFCASLSDIGEGPDTMPGESWEPVQAARRRLVETFTPLTNLLPLLLSKRPQNLPNLFPPEFLARCGVGTSIENRDPLSRIDELRKCPAMFRFLSVEPLIADLGEINLDGIHWVIVGGESGHNARPMHPDWVRSIRDQCQAAGVPFFFKQWGEWAPFADSVDRYYGNLGPIGNRNYNVALGRMIKHHGGTKLVDDRAEGWQPYMIAQGMGINGGGPHMFMCNVGKKAAGRVLDQVIWPELPTSADVKIF